MIVEIIQYAGSATLAGPVSLVLWRGFRFRYTVRSGQLPHVFEPHIRKDMHGPHIMGWCDVCNQGAKAWIHTNRKSSDAAEDNYLSPKTLLQLERDDIRWRFSNDPEWVAVFGEEYDPKTFNLIPQCHNGECGGPNDSCPRCNWEADEAQAKRDAERRDQKKTEYARRQTLIDKETKGTQTDLSQRIHEVMAYDGILWTLWNTVHDADIAKEEFIDICDELGMYDDSAFRKEVKNTMIFQRLAYCLSNPDKYWKRREEAWHNKLERDEEQRYRGIR